MTTGQRIASKRKELALSQEGLGEALGVSRQSIYKWESDTSLPDIDKLVALSRLFHVSVGWLLGVEEEPEEAAGDTFTEAQMKMIEEILNRYRQSEQKELSEEQQAQVEALVAQKLAARPRRRRWPWVLAAAVLVLAGWNLFQRLDRVDSQYNNLASSINNVTYSVNSQISGITNRVEEILKAQNDLTADYGTQLLSADLASNTVTFSVRVVPKTYVEGMEVAFLADSGDGPTEFPAGQGPGHEFTAEITCELTDSITLSAAFISGDTRQTQLLDNYSGLYSESLPQIDLSGLETSFLNNERDKDGLFHLASDYGWLRQINSETKFGTVEVQSLKVGLFKNFQLITWLEPCEKPQNYDVDGDEFFRFNGMDIRLEQGDILHFAAVYTDQYGRQGVAPSLPFFECFGDEISWPDISDGTPYFDFSHYMFS